MVAAASSRWTPSTSTSTTAASGQPQKSCWTPSLATVRSPRRDPIPGSVLRTASSGTRPVMLSQALFVQTQPMSSYWRTRPPPSIRLCDPSLGTKGILSSPLISPIRWSRTHWRGFNQHHRSTSLSCPHHHALRVPKTSSLPFRPPCSRAKMLIFD